MATELGVREKDLAVDAFEALRRAATHHSDRDFVVVDHRAQTASYRMLLDHATALGDLLADRGVRRGDRVCLAMSNSVEWVVAAFAAWRLGAVIVPLSTRLVDREVRHCLEIARPRTVIVHEAVRRRRLLEEWPSLREVEAADGGKVDVLVHGEFGLTWWPPVPWTREAGPGRSHAGYASSPERELEGAAALLFTSGTTSTPKGVILTHRALLRVAYEVGRRQGVGPHDRFFSVAPFFHCSGLMHALLTSLMAGATLFTASRYTAEDSLRVMREQLITVSHGPLPAGEHPEGAAFPSFTRAWTGGTRAQLKSLEAALGVRTCSLWGMTETGGCFALTTADDPAHVRHGSAGRPLPGLEFRIVGDDGEVVAEGAAGELHVRGWNVTPGYYRDPAATAASIDPDGWLRTGDLAEHLPGGRLRFIGRLKELIRVGGENLSPVEVEAVIAGIDGVTDAAVVHRPDQRLGEVPIAVIVTAPGTAVTAHQLREHCASMLADFKVPREFFLLDSIPRTHATGRIQRYRLQAEISAGRARHVE